jgi:hypothetical protein
MRGQERCCAATTLSYQPRRRQLRDYENDCQPMQSNAYVVEALRPTFGCQQIRKVDVFAHAFPS